MHPVALIGAGCSGFTTAKRLRDEGNTGILGDEYNRNPNLNETSNN